MVAALVAGRVVEAVETAKPQVRVVAAPAGRVAVVPAVLAAVPVPAEQPLETAAVVETARARVVRGLEVRVEVGGEAVVVIAI